MNTLLHPELIERVPVVGSRMAKRLNELAATVEPRTDDDVTVGIRTLNEADALEGLFEDLGQQEFNGGLEVVVVDNESSDRTREVAEHHGATVINLAREDFTYPVSMNMAMEAASNDCVLLTVGHARLSNTKLLRAGVRHFDGERVGGVFARGELPSGNASLTERLMAVGNMAFLKPPHKVTKAGLGVLGATNAMISRAVWDELGRFDERYERGGEDTALARRMLASEIDIIEDAVLSVHHTHGLGPINTVRQWREWMRTLKGPQAFDRQALAKRRPDLRSKILSNNLSLNDLPDAGVVEFLPAPAPPFAAPEVYGVEVGGFG